MFRKIKKIKPFWKPFVFLFLLSFLIINWSDIPKIFSYSSYRVVYSSVSEPLVKTLNGLDESEKREDKNLDSFTDKDYDYSDKEDTIEIPKIGIEAPIVFIEQDKEKDYEEALKKGVLYYPNSAKPGEEGMTIILGHSAPENWPEINYDWVFTDLNKLEAGDIIYIYFNHRQYNYKVTNTFFLEKGEEIPSLDLTNSKPVLILLSCWPPGKNQKRIAVEALLE